MMVWRSSAKPRPACVQTLKYIRLSSFFFWHSSVIYLKSYIYSRLLRVSLLLLFGLSLKAYTRSLDSLFID